MPLHFVTQTAPFALDNARVLGGFEVGTPPLPDSRPWPVQRVAMPLLGSSTQTVHEAWLADADMASGCTEGIAWRQAGGILFGVIDLHEADAPSPAGASALRHLGEQAYLRIFRLLDQQGVPHLWRLWNCIPDINGEQAGLERYRQFNVGRGAAFEGCARSVIEQVPAACALGVASGPLSVAFLAGTSPVLPIENPRQVSAYRYPPVYGPRSPTFSRAALARLGEREILFISGTASIVGHETLHLGDVVAQTHESLNNIVAVLGEAAKTSGSKAFALTSLDFRVYVRHAKDTQAVLGVMAERVGSATVHCVQADVCRSDLLVEVEALGLRSVP
jgi:chorismate lyase/3-hydroxybenzoate synthase